MSGTIRMHDIAWCRLPNLVPLRQSTAAHESHGDTAALPMVGHAGCVPARQYMCMLDACHCNANTLCAGSTSHAHA